MAFADEAIVGTYFHEDGDIKSLRRKREYEHWSKECRPRCKYLICIDHCKNDQSVETLGHSCLRTFIPKSFERWGSKPEVKRLTLKSLLGSRYILFISTTDVVIQSRHTHFGYHHDEDIIDAFTENKLLLTNSASMYPVALKSVAGVFQEPSWCGHN